MKQKVLSQDFPWFYYQNTIKDDFFDFPFYSHVVQMRSRTVNDTPDIRSPPLYDLTKKVIEQILNFNGICLSKIYRINFNSTHSTEKTSSPHVDHFFPHNVLLVYLSQNYGGDTLLFKQKYPEYFMEYNKITLSDTFSPDEDRAITFDGLRYHCQTSPRLNKRRVVMVATYDTA